MITTAYRYGEVLAKDKKVKVCFKNDRKASFHVNTIYDTDARRYGKLSRPLLCVHTGSRWNAQDRDLVLFLV